MILVWCLLGIIYLRRKRKVGLKGLREGSMLVRLSRAPALPLPQARKTKQGCKPMLLDPKQAGNPERDFGFIFSFIEKSPSKCLEPLRCHSKTCFLVSKENVRQWNEHCNCVDWNLLEGPGEETRAQWSPSVRGLLASADALSIASH